MIEDTRKVILNGNIKNNKIIKKIRKKYKHFKIFLVYLKLSLYIQKMQIFFYTILKIILVN